jgi:N-methylhydantoinase A
MSYIVGVDVGGTFTDAVLLDKDGNITPGKSLSTPPDFSKGVIDSIQNIAENRSTTLEEVLRNTSLLLHCTTTAENAVITGDMSKAILITTKGFEDILYLQRGAYGRWSGLPEEMIKHPVMTDKPPSVIPRNLIFGVRERTDYKGEIIASINEQEIRTIAQELSKRAVESVGVCFLWSFQNPANEKKVAEIIRSVFPKMPITLSHELAPFMGEYERVSSTALNARLSPIANTYLQNLEALFKGKGFNGSLLVMQAYGGLLSVSEASKAVVGLIESGPAAGVMGSQYLGRIIGAKNIIACDMGGTSFKVGVITDGTFDYAIESQIERYHYSIPKIDIASIGSGGGSIVWIEPRTGLPRVGPDSAGSSPGPICYNLGGEEPTITDTDLLLGYLDPDYFLGGRMKLNYEKTLKLFDEKISKPLAMKPKDAASRVYDLVNSQMAALLHKVTVERGLDPREYVLFSYGGAAGAHAIEFARELEVKKVIVPMTASVNGAFGAISADVSQENYRTRQMDVPPPLEEVNKIFGELESKALSQLRQEGFSEKNIKFHKSITLKFRLQVYSLDTPLLTKGSKVTEKDLEETYRRFEELYEQKHGKGSAYKEAGMEIVSFRVKAIGEITKPSYRKFEKHDKDPSKALINQRNAYFKGREANTKFYKYDSLKPGNEISGPAVILTPVTTVVLPPKEHGYMDEYKNIIIELGR